MAEGSRGVGRRPQVRLWDLAVLVMASAYVLDVVRRSRAGWGGAWPDLAHALALVVLATGTAVGLVLGGRAARRPEAGGGRAWATTWRVVALAWLVWSVQGIDRSLGLEPSIVILHGPALRLRLGPLMTTFGLVGLVLAASPLRPRSAGAIARPGRGSWPSVLLATAVGLAILALVHGIIPYLVLVAIEAVRDAMRRAPLVAHPPVLDRLMTAGLEALPGLVGCVATAIWVDDDLRASAVDPPEARAPRSWPGVIARVATVALAWAGSAYVVLVSIPRLHPDLAEGIATLIGPSTAATIALGFASLAAGIAARPAARLATATEPANPEAPGRPTRRPGAWPRRVGALLVILVCAEIIGSAVQSSLHDLDYRWYLPIGLDAWMWLLNAPARRLGYDSGWGLLFGAPGLFLIVAATIGMMIWLALAIFSKDGGRPAALDALAADRPALGRFLGWWLALTTVMVAGLPGLGVVGVALTHAYIRWAPW